MAEHVGQCGHPVSRRGVKKCRACWQDRGADRPDKPQIIGACGHPVARKGAKYCRDCYDSRGRTPDLSSVAVSQNELQTSIHDLLRTGRKTVEELATMAGVSPGAALDAVLGLQSSGLNLHKLGDHWSLEKHVPIQEREFVYTSRDDNTFTFGLASDAHLCSKYAREDVLGDLYDAFEREGVDRVFNAGNYIDGEDDKNRFDLTIHGLEPQVAYLVEHYPQRGGITTYAITGEDHEGWFSRREAIDVGRFVENHMRQAGREDWVDLGFIEARIDLVNANTGVRGSLVVMHPGGGSSYAYSYRPQKIVEALSGGEKPSVLVIGHYHKLSCHMIRGVWTIQAGCQQDQTVFMRKKGLDAHVGGHIITLEQDPKTGAIFRCVSDERHYYDRGYYNDRWSKSSPVVQAPKYLGGVVPVGAK